MKRQPPPLTKTLSADLAALCRQLARTAAADGAATHAILINANAARLNLALPRGGTLLLLRFPVAAIARDERPLQELIAPAQPPITYRIHAQTETLDGAGPAYSAEKGDPSAT